MKVLKIRPRVVVSAIALCFTFPLPSFAGDNSQLTGKNLENNRDLIGSVMQGRNYVIETDRLGNIKQVVDAGANGSGKEAPPVSGTAASIKTAQATEATSVELPVNYQGQDAVDFIGADLATTAESHGLAEDKLKELLLTDSTIRVDSNKRIFFIDDSADDAGPPSMDVASAAGMVARGATANGAGLPIGSVPDKANAFKLHSKPGASKTIYLDFNGYTATNTAWAREKTIKAPAFDLDGNPGTFNDNELGNIVSVWNRVSEDYIPFDVDVTTEAPSEAALVRSSKTDNNYGAHVVITKSGTISCSCGGVAYVGVVSLVKGLAYQPAWVFQQSLANNEKYIAEAVAHEAGHNLGLFHDGQKVGTTLSGYYTGHGSGSTGWSPIMGVGYYKNLTQWSGGTYPGANNLQNDLAVLASNGFTSRPDDVGNSFDTASTLTGYKSGASQTIQTNGVIETESDIDMFRIDTAGGQLKLTVKPFAKGPNLDTKIKLSKADGTTVTSNAPETDLSSSISASVPAGTYFLAVSGSGHKGTGSDYGYPAYASLGQYQITGSYAASSAIAVKPIAILKASTQSVPSPAPSLHASSLKLTVAKGSGVSARMTIVVVDEKNRPVPNAVVKGSWSGSFFGATKVMTGMNGIGTQSTKSIPAGKGGVATFYLTGIQFPGYVYKPELNVKKIISVTW